MTNADTFFKKGGEKYFYNMTYLGEGSEAEPALSATARDREEEYKVRISAMAFSLGSFSVSSAEKAKTILRNGVAVDPEREYKHILRRLGTLSTAFPEHGENIEAVAATTIIKLALFNNVDLDDFTEAEVFTESGEELSKNKMHAIMKLVNDASKELEKRGVKIGRLRQIKSGLGKNGRERKAVHSNQHQNACASAGVELYEKAAGGGIPKGHKILGVSVDDSHYRPRSPSTETGHAIGGVAFALEGVEKGDEKGLLLSSKVIGESSIDSSEFLKNVVVKLGAGLSIMNTDPIVLGSHSNYTYLYLAYQALKSALGEELGGGLDEITKYDVVMHIPYPVMPKDAAAYFGRHMARHNEEMKASIRSQTGMEEPLIPDFDRLQSEFGFLHAIGEVYAPFEIVAESEDRIRNTVLSETAKQEVLRLFAQGVEKALPQAAELSANELRKIASEHSVAGDYKRIILETAGRLDALSIRETLTNEEVRGAFKELSAKIAEFEKKDTEYNERVRGTKELERLTSEIHMNESHKIPEKVGNLDTGSALLGIISNVIYTENNKDILAVFYGSGSTVVLLKIRPGDVKEMKERLKANESYEFSRIRPLLADEFLKRDEERMGIVKINEELPIGANQLGSTVNGDALFVMARDISKAKASRQTEKITIS